MNKAKGYNRLSEAEIDRIAYLRAHNLSISSIAKDLKRAKSTISECINKNSDFRSNGKLFYSSLAIKKRSERKLKQRKKIKLFSNNSLFVNVHFMMSILRYSPEQVSQTLKKYFPGDKEMNISSEAIYEFVFLRAKGELKEELLSALRRPRKGRKARRRKSSLQGTLPNLLSIDERPKGVLTRRIPGHWESDLIMGKDHKSALISLVERKFRYTILIRILSLDATTFANEVSEAINKLPKKLRKTMTHDNGKEIAKAEKITAETGIQVYVTHPRSPWERGTNENTNGLVREFFPKGTDFRKITDNEVIYAQELLNIRPRKTLNWMTPTEMMLKTFG